jgi:hypothetical protein
VGILLQSCTKDGQGIETNIRLQLTYNGDPMVTQRNYTYPDGKTFVLTKFSTYMTGLSTQSDIGEQQIDDVRLINMTETLQSEQTSAQGILIYSGKIKGNSIDQIHFNLGLTPEQNSTVPADHDPGTPLAMAGEYWLAWKSYIFTKIEGWIDLDGDGMAETGVALHLGSDQAMRSFRVFPPSSDNSEITIQIDLARIFDQEGKIYDIEANPQIHSLSQIEALRELSNNLEKAIFIKAIL